MWRELYWLPARRLEEMDTFRFCPTCGGPLGSRSLKAGDPERLVCGQCGFVVTEMVLMATLHCGPGTKVLRTKTGEIVQFPSGGPLPRFAGLRIREVAAP